MQLLILSQAGINNCIPHNTMGCNYLSLPEIPASDTKVLIHDFGHVSLHWRHNDHGGVSNHQPRGCLLNRLFRRRWKKTSKLRVTDLCAGTSPGPVNSPHGPVTRKMFPFDDVSMCWILSSCSTLIFRDASLTHGRSYDKPNIFKNISKKFCILIRTSLELVPKCPINNNGYWFR